MKKDDERQVCPPDTRCMASLIGTILALVISILAWIQKLSNMPKQECSQIYEFKHAIEKLKEITAQAEAMSKAVPQKNKKQEENIEVSDEDSSNGQVLYGETPNRLESCTECCEKVLSGSEVTYVEAYPAKDSEQETDETQTTSAELPAKVSFRLEKETQDVRDVKEEYVQASTTECVRDGTQVSDPFLPQTQQETRREDADGSAGHKQYETKTDLKRNHLTPRQNRTSQEEIAEVYRTFVNEDACDAEFEEEKVAKKTLGEGRKGKKDARDYLKARSDFGYVDKTKYLGFGRQPYRFPATSTPKRGKEINPSEPKTHPTSSVPKRPRDFDPRKKPCLQTCSKRCDEPCIPKSPPSFLIVDGENQNQPKLKGKVETLQRIYEKPATRGKNEEGATFEQNKQATRKLDFEDEEEGSEDEANQ